MSEWAYQWYTGDVTCIAQVQHGKGARTVECMAGRERGWGQRWGEQMHSRCTACDKLLERAFVDVACCAVREARVLPFGPICKERCERTCMSLRKSQAGHA